MTRKQETIKSCASAFSGKNLRWSIVVLLIFMYHVEQAESFYELQCKGVYDKSCFARLDLVCDDCYNLFRVPQLHQLCRKNCFTTDYFKGCLDVLLLSGEGDLEIYQNCIKHIHGAEPDH